ncbi:MAG: GNAT family N-acetyltransferase [Candidatus Heimdallarchaeaceae archaeon]|jgi:ribosomal protein S18 acetylase RimI-like enzyme
MDYNLKSLVRLEKNRIEEAAEVFSRAFADDPLLNWFLPENSSRKEMSFSYFKFRIRFGVLFGEVYATSQNLEGLAVWFPSNKMDMTYWRMLKSGGMRLFKELGFSTVQRMMSIGDFVSDLHHHQINFPHWYLAPMGVDPDYQGKGYASRLMRSMLKRLDNEKLPCFLETQNENNVEIYKHYGFKIVGKAKIPKSDLEHWSMLRDPPI